MIIRCVPAQKAYAIKNQNHSVEWQPVFVYWIVTHALWIYNQIAGSGFLRRIVVVGSDKRSIVFHHKSPDPIHRFEWAKST